MKSTMSFLNAVYFGLFVSSVSASPVGLNNPTVSTHPGFPTSIGVSSFPFPVVSLIASFGITTVTSSSFAPNPDNSNVYLIPLKILL